MAARKKAGNNKEDFVNKFEISDKISAKIWNTIKNINLEMFGLPNQFVNVNTTPVIELCDHRLYLNLRSQAVLPQLEEKLKGVSVDGKKLVVEMGPKFAIVTVDDT